MGHAEKSTRRRGGRSWRMGAEVTGVFGSLGQQILEWMKQEGFEWVEV